MKLILFIVITVLAILGAFALLEWWTEKRATPADRDASRPRRSFLSLMIALVGGLLIGSYSWHRNRQSRQELQQLFELELLLVQLDGLVKAGLAQGDINRLLPLIKELVKKIGEYGSRTKPALKQLEEELYPHDYAVLRQAATLIAGGFNHIENPTPDDSTAAGINDSLLTMQEGIRLARAKTRELIDARISSF
jgi:uncharacterized protein YjiS (DUF1127 family)